MIRLVITGCLVLMAFCWSLVTSTLFPVLQHPALHIGTLMLGAVGFWVGLWKVSKP